MADISRYVFVAAFAALVGASGCSKDSGQTNVKPPDATVVQQETKQNAEEQIANVQNNPNIPENQKQAIIGQIRAGAARAGTNVGAPPGK